jgi:tRNA A-37 threonylcarbamoyl transferase component Bud32
VPGEQKPGAPTGPPGHEAAAEEGRYIGRYQLLAKIGSGAMGVVWKAHDPRLDRDVALKLLHRSAFEGGDGDSEEARQRLVREARAMARISHDNVLTVFDADTHEGDVYIAMELVEGQTLDDWLAEGHPWREVVAVFALAAKGLAAAHAADIAHRDFKPPNVLVGRDGRVRVADFGLVGITVQGPPAAEARGGLELTLTRTGAILGSPLFMAPEQHAGEKVGPAADQFAFCVALYRALYHQVPFAGDTLEELRKSVFTGQPREPRRHPRVGARLRRAIMRGLERSPERRHPSMAELIAILERARTTRRRSVLALAGVLVVAAAGSSIVASVWRSKAQMCRVGAARMDEVWTSRVADRVRTTFVRTRHPAAEHISERLAAGIDAFRRRWIEQYSDACEATVVRKEQSPRLFEQKAACLEARRSSLEATVGLYLEADRALVSRALAVAPPTAELEGCDSDRLLAAYPLPDKDRAPAVAKLARELDRIDVLERAGRHPEALDGAQVAAAAARQLDYPPIQARALFLLAEATSATHAEAAVPLYAEAARAAARARDDGLLARILAGNIQVLGAKLGKPEAALALRPAAEGAAMRGPEDRLVEAFVASSLATVFEAAGDQQQARQQWERVIAARRAALGDDHPAVAAAEQDLATLLSRGDKSDRARALTMFEKVLATQRRLYGSDQHPDIAFTLAGMGDTYRHERRYAEARVLYQEAASIYDGAYGPGSSLARELKARAAELARMHDGEAPP